MRARTRLIDRAALLVMLLGVGLLLGLPDPPATTRQRQLDPAAFRFTN